MKKRILQAIAVLGCARSKILALENIRPQIIGDIVDEEGLDNLIGIKLPSGIEVALIYPQASSHLYPILFVPNNSGRTNEYLLAQTLDALNLAPRTGERMLARNEIPSCKYREINLGLEDLVFHVIERAQPQELPTIYDTGHKPRAQTQPLPLPKAVA